MANDATLLIAGFGLILLVFVALVAWILIPRIRTIYALVTTQGDIFEFQRPHIEKNFVTLGNGKYHISRRHFRTRTRFIFGGMIERHDRICYWVEPLKEPHPFYELNEDLKKRMEEESAWDMKTYSNDLKARAMFENVPARAPWALIVAALAILALIIVAITKIRGG